jgi:Methyltransferase small domain
MARDDKFKSSLGQHMTPAAIADLLVEHLPRGVSRAVDLAVGDGRLLTALQRRWPSVRVYGTDCDPDRVRKAKERIGHSSIGLADGLAARIPSYVANGPGRFAVVGNPPFLATPAREIDQRLQSGAFPGVTSKHGLRRLEMSFLARGLIEAKRRDGLLAMILPSAFSSGLQYASYRRSVLENYCVLKSIEIHGGGYRDTEATTTLLIIDTARMPTREVEIGRYFTRENLFQAIYRGKVLPDQRLDARYWGARELHACSMPTLAEIGVTINRGRRSKAEAARDQQQLLHTTDLCRIGGRSIRLPEPEGPLDEQDIVVEKGDILLPRTGTRVRWEPVVVIAGRAVISDHLLRIRAPHGLKEATRASFRHPHFRPWLHSVSKGVCATVVTKSELMQMPLFAL